MEDFGENLKFWKSNHLKLEILIQTPVSLAKMATIIDLFRNKKFLKNLVDRKIG